MNPCGGSLSKGVTIKHTPITAEHFTEL